MLRPLQLRPHRRLHRHLDDRAPHFPPQNLNSFITKKKMGVRAQALDRLDWRLSSGLAL
jgi:hypothetical protein